MPVLPPCGTTATPAAWVADSTAATSAVLPGRTTASGRPPGAAPVRVVRRHVVRVGEDVGVAHHGAQPSEQVGQQVGESVMRRFSLEVLPSSTAMSRATGNDASVGDQDRLPRHVLPVR